MFQYCSRFNKHKDFRYFKIWKDLSRKIERNNYWHVSIEYKKLFIN